MFFHVKGLGWGGISRHPPPLCPCETLCMVWSTLCMVWQTSSYQCSVATKIENGLKTNAKILWIQNMDKDFLFLKMDWRLIWWLFVNSKFFEDIWRLLKIIEDSSNILTIFEDLSFYVWGYLYHPLVLGWHYAWCRWHSM